MENTKDPNCFRYGTKGFATHGCWYSRMKKEGEFTCTNKCVQQLLADNKKLKEELEKAKERFEALKCEI